MARGVGKNKGGRNRVHTKRVAKGVCRDGARGGKVAPSVLRGWPEEMTKMREGIILPILRGVGWDGRLAMVDTVLRALGGWVPPVVFPFLAVNSGKLGFLQAVPPWLPAYYGEGLFPGGG